MGFGISTFLIAVGAVLRFAVERVRWQQVNLHTVGDVLLAVGILGLLISTILWMIPARRRRAIVTEEPDYQAILRRS